MFHRSASVLADSLLLLFGDRAKRPLIGYDRSEGPFRDLRRQSQRIAGLMVLLGSAALAQPPGPFVNSFEQGLLGWSSTTASSGLPSCEALPVGDPQTATAIDTALGAAIAQSLDPLSESEFWSIIHEAADAMDCALGQTGFLRAPSSVNCVAPGPGVNCQREYCCGTDYCGPGDSATNWFTWAVGGAASESLNAICFSHDRCYDSHCFSGGAGCTWSLQAGVDQCDQEMFQHFSEAFPNPNLQTTGDRLIVRAADLLKARQVATPERCGSAAPCGNGLCLAQVGVAGACAPAVPGTSCLQATDCISGTFCYRQGGIFAGTSGQCVQIPAGSLEQTLCYGCSGGTTGGVTLPYRVKVWAGQTLNSIINSCRCDWGQAGCGSPAGCANPGCGLYQCSNSTFWGAVFFSNTADTF